MNLIRLAAFLLLIWVIYRIISLAMKKKKNKQLPGIQNLVRCAYCDLQVPQNTALQKAEKFYCCEEHLSEDRKN